MIVSEEVKIPFLSWNRSVAVHEKLLSFFNDLHGKVFISHSVRTVSYTQKKNIIYIYIYIYAHTYKVWQLHM